MLWINGFPVEFEPFDPKKELKRRGLSWQEREYLEGELWQIRGERARKCLLVLALIYLLALLWGTMHYAPEKVQLYELLTLYYWRWR